MRSLRASALLLAVVMIAPAAALAGAAGFTVLPGATPASSGMGADAAADPTLPGANPDPRVQRVLDAMGPHGLVIGGGYDPDGLGHGFHSCGEDIALVFKNPDLRVESDGYVHASGWFFIQFQAIGDRAFDIAKFSFSFGKPIPENLHNCDTQPWVTGAYLQNYRTDGDPRDGFHVPINTTAVPDGEYGAAVHAYDSNGRELTRYFVSAQVLNGCVQSCRGVDEGTIISHDKIKPWPIVLPGDGEPTEGHPGGLSVEFAEQLRVRDDGTPDLQVWVNGVRVPMQEFEPTPKDDDVIPDNPYSQCPLPDPAPNCRVWGPGYNWPNGILRGEDIVRVRAVDLNGNIVEKILHMGDPTIGGRIVLEFPEVEITGSGQDKTAVNGSARYPFAFENTGDGGLHGNIILTTPEHIRAAFDSDHIMMGAGDTHYANLTVRALDSLKPGTYTIEGAVHYKKGDQEVSKPFDVTFRLEERSDFSEEDEEFAKGSQVERPPVEEEEPVESQDEQPAPSNGIPAPGALFALAGLGAAAFAVRRRR